MTRPTYRQTVALTLVALLGAYVWLFVNGARRIGGDTGDFNHFYLAARAMLEGRDIYAAGLPGTRSGYIYPPLLAFLYMPFAFLQPDGAALGILIANVLLSLVTVVVAARVAVTRLGAPSDVLTTSVVALVTTVLIFDKAKGEIQMWQTNVLVLLMFTLGLAWLDKRPLLSGLAMGLAVNIKYLPLVFLPYLLLRRRYRAAAYLGLGSVIFALLPAVAVGWRTNVGYLRAATAGMARLVGIDSGPGPVANVEELTAPFSISITSAMARLCGGEQHTALALALSGTIALVCTAVAVFLYRCRGVRLLAWPAPPAQELDPCRAVLALEWVGIIVFVLAFGPQTNPRHLYMLLLVLAPATVMLLVPRPGVSRAPLLVGIAVLCAGIYLPPGGPAFDQYVRQWRLLGGPSWCLLIMFSTLLWTGLKYATAGDGSSPTPRKAIGPPCAEALLTPGDTGAGRLSDTGS